MHSKFLNNRACAGIVVKVDAKGVSDFVKMVRRSSIIIFQPDIAANFSVDVFTRDNGGIFWGLGIKVI
eukprot:14979265-Ditylum_brightwellii.AAC.2